MEGLARLYRHSTMCTILHATPAEYLSILGLLPPGADLFQDTGTTLDFVQRWRYLQGSGWSTADVVASLAFRNDNVDIAAAKCPAANLTLTGILSSEIKETLLTSQAAPQGLTEIVTDLDNRSQEAYGALASRLFDRISSNDKLTTKALFVADVRDHTPDSDEDDTEDNTDEKIDHLDNEAKLAILIDLSQRKRRAVFVEAALPTLRAQFLLDAIVRTVGTAVGGGLEAPVLSMLAMANFLPQAEDKEPIDDRKKENNDKAKKETKQSALDVLEDLLVSQHTKNDITDAFFCPTATDSYTFVILIESNPADIPQHVSNKDAEAQKSPEDTAPPFSINGIDLPLSKASDGTAWQSTPVMMTTGQPYVLSSLVPLNGSRAYWATKQSSLMEFTSQTLTPHDTVTAITDILGTATRAARLVKKLGLSLEELKYVATSPSALIQLNPHAPSLTSLCILESYRSLRDSLPGTSGEGGSHRSLVDLLAWLGNPTGTQTVVTLASRIATATGWNESQVATAIDLKYPGMPAEDIISRFRNINELVSLQAVLELSQRIAGTPSQRRQGTAVPHPLLILFQIATASVPAPAGRGGLSSGKDNNSTAAAGLQACLGDGPALEQCIRDMREAQRTALVAFLLQQQYIRNMGIADADGLFGLFLLDVQMGATLEITRIKAAISSIQLFVQRCLLGLEPGAATVHIDQTKWAWMSRHNIWQATRKAFLYPENWIEPSLRDDKTPQFDALEATLLSKDLSWNTFSRAMREYVQALQPIAELDIVSYLREDTPEGTKTETYHFFGRTRSAPYAFYHRTMCIGRPGRGRVVWSPWTKIEADAMTYEADWDEKREEKKPDSSVWWGLPSISHFIFAPETKGADVSIQVAYQRPATLEDTSETQNLQPVGNFAVSGERIIAVQTSNQQECLGNAVSANFHKLSWTASPDPETATDDRLATPNASFYSYTTDKNISPLLAIPKRSYTRSLTWTLSFSSSEGGLGYATGLVVDEQTGEGPAAHGRSIFMFPRDVTTLDLTVGSSNLWKSASNQVMEHSSARSLREAVCQREDGTSVDTLFRTLSVSLVDNADWGKAVVARGVSNYHELATSYALYNWELGHHAVLLAVDRFHATQQFDLALRAARLVFDPTTMPPATAQTTAEKTVACWQFPPFRDLAADKSQMFDKFTGWPDDSTLEIAVTERRSNPWTAHSTARGRPQAYMKWIVMKYIEILIAAGDVSFRQGSMEMLPLAIQRYVEAAHVLGPDPPAVPRLAKAITRNFKTVGDPGVAMNLELAFPFICEVERRGSERAPDDSRQRSALLCILSTTYFSLPLSPKYASLRTLVVDRLFRARNNLDISGRPIIYSMSEPTIDPAAVMNALSGGAGAVNGLASLVNDVDCPMPYQRFSVLLGKALELCNEVRSMGEQFLTAREKQDGETLAPLKAHQDTTRQKMMINVKALQRYEITKAIEALQQSCDAAVAYLQYLLRLTGDPLDRLPDQESKGWEDIAQVISTPTSDDLRMSPYEEGDIISAAVATGLKAAAAGMEMTVGVLRAIPEVTSNAQPLGCGVTIKADATNAARLTKGIMGGLKIGSLIALDASTAFARVGTLTRQLQERRMQANAKGREIKHIDKQIEVQRVRLALNARELNIQRAEMTNAAETEAWYRSKYTNSRLYAWLEGQLRALHFELYGLAADMCRRAERAFRFERGARTPVQFLRAGGYWDSNRDGLLAAQQLSLDLRRMEAAFLHTPAHDFELSKNISLRQLDPQALMALRDTGTAIFSIPEMLFDLDFPGHHMRRLQSVAISVPCIMGPHATLAATLSLTQHSYRVSAAASTADNYLTASISDGSFRTDVVPIAAVATSSGLQYTGTFNMAFGTNSNDGRYGPFEGAGAVSSWRLELPPSAVRTFDYSTISDVILHLRYTAVDGGPLLKRAASGAVSTLQTRAEGLGTRD
ncbi:hypothetical protein EsH8_XIV_000002 [Colletotrichum jinshuiense]